MAFLCPIVVGFANCFVIVCNRSQKEFRDCLDKKIKIRTVKGLFDRFYGKFKSRFGATCVGFFFFFFFFVGIIYATIGLEC